MRILVDYMPDKPHECIYCKDESTMDFTRYICKWNNSDHRCWDTHECPYFTEMDDKFEELINDYDCLKKDTYRYG